MFKKLFHCRCDICGESAIVDYEPEVFIVYRDCCYREDFAVCNPKPAYHEMLVYSGNQANNAGDYDDTFESYIVCEEHKDYIFYLAKEFKDVDFINHILEELIQKNKSNT